MSARNPHAALLLALICWVAGLTGSLVHDAQATHVRCAEHGELIEWAGDHGNTSIVAQARAPTSPDQHGHGCQLPSTSHKQALVLPAAASVAAGHWVTTASPQARQAPARGPPLTYAPKTSPPTS